MQTSKKVILLFHVILLVVFAIAVHRQVESSYMRIGEKSDAIINEAADVYMYDIHWQEHEGYLHAYLNTNGTLQYETGPGGWLEYEIDGTWYRLEERRNRAFCGKKAFYRPGELAVESFLPVWYCGRLRKGHYRFLCCVSEQGEQGEFFGPYVIAIEFDIP